MMGSRVVRTVMLALVLWPALAFAADTRMMPSCDGKYGLCRYIDRETKQEVIPARFERAFRFSEGLAAVSIEGRFGYIDARGEVAIPPQFELAGEFYQGLAEVLVGDKVGVIDRNGRFVVQPQFKRAVPITKEVVLATEGTWAPHASKTYQRLDWSLLLLDGTFGLYHVNGHWIRRPDLQRVFIFEREGRGLVWASERQRGDIGLLDINGNWMVEPQFDAVHDLRGGRAVVNKRVDGRWLSGAIDEVGRLVIPLQELRLHGWKRGWGSAQESRPGGKWALLDVNGAMIGGRTFDRVEVPDEGDIAVVTDGERHYGLDRKGNAVPHPRNGRVYASCPEGIRVVEMDGKIQIFDAASTPTTPHLFAQLNQPLECGVPYLVRLGAKWGFVKPDGKLMFDPPVFDDVRAFTDGHAFVKQDGNWGVIDAEGRFVLGPKFKSILASRDGLFHVDTGTTKRWITASEEERPEPPVRHDPPGWILNCGHGLQIVQRGDHWGIVDADGLEIVAPTYRAIGCFKNGLAWVPVESRHGWCAIDRAGRVRESEQCMTARYPYVMTHAAPERFHEDPFESSVLWSRAFLDFAARRRDTPPRWMPWSNAVSHSIQWP